MPPSSAEWPINCEGREELCAVVRKTAVERELLVAVCNSGIIQQLSKWVESNRRAHISNMMIVAIDESLPKWLDEHGVAYWKRKTSAAGSHKISAQKFMYVKEFLTIGCSVLMSDIDVVYIQNPFHSLHRVRPVASADTLAHAHRTPRALMRETRLPPPLPPPLPPRLPSH